MQREKAGVGQVPSPSAELETLRACIKELEATLQGSQARFRRREQELEALQATVLDLTSAHDLPFLLETIVERAAGLLDAPAGGLYLYEPQEEQVRCVVSHNTVRDYRGVVLKVGEGAAGTVAEIRRPLIIDDYGTWPGRAPAFEEERPFRAVLAVPMIWQGQIIGVIDVVCFAPDRVFSEQDRDLLMLFASHAAIAVKNSRLYEQARAEIAARERLERQIEERRRYLEHVLACAPDAIVTLDPQHRVLEWNPGAEALFGYSAQEAIGRDLDDLIAAPEPEMYAQAVDLTEEAFAGRSVPPIETIRFRKDGTPVHVIVAGSPIVIGDELVGTVAVYTDISEHKRITEELRQVSEFSRGIVENMGEGVVVQDADGFFTFLNPATAVMLGYGLEELIGQHWRDYVPPDQQPIVQAADERRKRGKADQYEVELQRRDGTRVPVLISASPLFDRESGHFEGTVAVFTDISQRLESEKKLARYARGMAALYETMIEITRQTDMEALLQAIVQRAVELAEARSSGIFFVKPSGDEIEFAVGHNLPRDYVGTSHRLGEGLSGRVAQSGEPLMVTDYVHWEGRLETYREDPIQRILGVPLKVGQRVIGVLSVADDSRADPFDEDTIRLLRLLADQAAIAIENARLYEETRRQAEHMATINRVGLAISAALDVSEVLNTLYEMISHVTDVQVLCVALYDEATDQISFPLLAGPADQGPIEPRNLDEQSGLTGHVIRTKEPLYLPDLGVVPEDAPCACASIGDRRLRSYLGVPLTVRERVIGVLSIQSCEPHAYSEADIDLLVTTSIQASIAIEKARLFQAEREQRQMAEALSRATMAVSSRLELDQVLDEILEQVSRVVPDDSANIMLIEGDHVRIVRWRGYDLEDEEYLREIDFNVQETPNLRQMRDTGEALVIPDTHAYAGWMPTSSPVRSYAGAPIRVRDEVIGFLNINKRVPGFFTPAHAERLQAFANQVGQAIGNARFFQILEQGKRDWEVTFDAMQDAVALLDREGRIVRANRAFQELVGSAFSHILGRAPDDALEGDRCLEAACRLKEALREGQPAACIHKWRDRLFEVQVTPVPGSALAGAGSAVNAIYVRRDITARHLAEAEIRRRNQELALLNRIIVATAASRDVESILEIVCRDLALALGVPQAAAAMLNEGKTEAVVVAEYLAEGRPPALGVALPVKGNPSVEHLLEHKRPFVVDDARTDWRMEAVRPISLQRGTVSLLVLPLIVEGEVIGSLGIDAIEFRPFTQDEVDMAQRVADQVSGALARVRLEETQRRLTAAIEQAAESIIITDIQGKVLYVNPAFERASGYSSTEVIGRVSHILKSSEHDPELYELLQTLRSGEVWQGRLVNRGKDGSLYLEESTITPVRDQAGKIVNYVAVNRDVTREVQLEEELRQAQKMEALGRLAGGIAHDFNNLLTVIQLSARLLQRQLRPQDPLWEHVQRIQETSDRAATLTRRLLSFSRRELIEPRILDLNQVVSDLSRMLKRIIGEDIELLTDLGDDLWLVQADPSQIEQVIVNLAVNARDAMPQGGTLLIETSNAVLDEIYTAEHVDVEPGEYVLLSITDTGVGIDEEAQRHIFEPFFTTKERGRGTGLGLAAVFGIVKQNKGHIWFHSQEGVGTTFRVYLPRTVARASQPANQPAALVMSGLVPGTETILVVEDEAEVLNLIVRVLQACGYQVLVAQEGSQALQLSREQEGPIHLLITDIIMPGMSGKELAEKLRRQRADTRLLFISGYPDQEIVREGDLKDAAFLPKPFTVEDLTSKVRAVLDAKA